MGTIEKRRQGVFKLHYHSAKQLLDEKDELDVLLLDIEMPEMDEIEADYQLREQNVEYKIIMLTAREECYKEAFKFGYKIYIEIET